MNARQQAVMQKLNDSDAKLMPVWPMDPYKYEM